MADGGFAYRLGEGKGECGSCDGVISAGKDVSDADEKSHCAALPNGMRLLRDFHVFAKRTRSSADFA